MPTFLELAPVTYAYEESSKALRDDDREGLTNRRQGLMRDIDEIGQDLRDIGDAVGQLTYVEIVSEVVVIRQKAARLLELAEKVRENDVLLGGL